MHLFAALLLAAALPHQAYVWQRNWDDTVTRAVTNAAPALDRLVILNAEVTGPRVVTITPDYAALRGPVGLVLRANASARISVTLATNILATARAHNLMPAELQIDFDCPESKLPAYGDWLAPIRAAITPTPLTITALPSWLRHETEFRKLITATDAFVLQVHSLDANAHTLCDPELARRAVAQASRFGKPFRVALPTCGYVVGFHPNGKLLGLSAEGPSLSWPAETTLHELRADPATMAALVRDWTAQPPSNFTGFIWYRLPTDHDKLNWRWPTLAAVIAGRTPQPSLVVETRQTQPGLLELDLLNNGDADALANITVTVRWRNAALLACDALAGFDTSTSVKETNATRFVGNPRLAPGQRRAIGWLRFRDAKEVVCETRIE